MSVTPDRQSGGAPGLRIKRSLLDTIIDHLAAAGPNEGVGLVATRRDGVVARAVAFYPGTNIDHSPTRYTMDPAEVLAAFREMGANGWTLGAIAHSHLRSAPAPSATDLREAYYRDALLLIVGFGSGVVEARLWRVGTEDLVVREVPLLVEGD